LRPTAGKAKKHSPFRRKGGGNCDMASAEGKEKRGLMGRVDAIWLTKKKKKKGLPRLRKRGKTLRRGRGERKRALLVGSPPRGRG